MVPKPTLEKRGRRNREEEREGAWERGARLGSQGKERKRERGGIYGAHAEVQNTLRLKLKTKTPRG